MQVCDPQTMLRRRPSRTARQGLPRHIARDLDLLNESAVAVMGVEPGSPAARAGLREGDLIIELGGRLINTIDDLHRALSRLPAAKGVAVTVVRENTRVELGIVPGTSA